MREDCKRVERAGVVRKTNKTYVVDENGKKGPGIGIGTHVKVFRFSRHLEPPKFPKSVEDGEAAAGAACRRVMLRRRMN